MQNIGASRTTKACDKRAIYIQIEACPFLDYIAKKKTQAIQGIFIMLIFLSHAEQYFKLDSAYDTAYAAVSEHMGQLVVVMFFFYSGYGMMESVKKKGSSYVSRIMTQRFPKVLLQFDIAVIIYLLLNVLLLHKTYPVTHILFSLIGYTRVGNSNWYIFVVLCMYVLFYAACRIAYMMKFLSPNGSQLAGLLLFFVLSFLFISWEIHKGTYKCGKNTSPLEERNRQHFQSR